MTKSFFSLPRELRDVVYDELWRQTPALQLLAMNGTSAVSMDAYYPNTPNQLDRTSEVTDRKCHEIHEWPATMTMAQSRTRNYMMRLLLDCSIHGTMCQSTTSDL